RISVQQGKKRKGTTGVARKSLRVSTPSEVPHLLIGPDSRRSRAKRRQFSVRASTPPGSREKSRATTSGARTDRGTMTIFRTRLQIYKSGLVQHNVGSVISARYRRSKSNQPSLQVALLAASIDVRYWPLADIG